MTDDVLTVYRVLDGAGRPTLVKGSDFQVRDSPDTLTIVGGNGDVVAVFRHWTSIVDQKCLV